MSLIAAIRMMFAQAMLRMPRRWIWPAIAASAFVIESGCATIDAAKPSPDGTSQKQASEQEPKKPAAKSFTHERDERRKAVVAEFDLQRDRAEYQAALSQWQRGETAAARETLAPVLARNPDYREAHLLAAQLDLFENKPKAALAHARHVLVAHPDDAEAHFEAAMALDAMGAAADALPHYERAAQLAPKVEAYQVSYQTAVGGAIPPPMGRAGDSSAASITAPGDAVGCSAASDDSGRAGQPVSNANQRAALSAAREGNVPDGSQTALDAAIDALRQNRLQAAIEVAGAAIKRFPDSAPLWRTLGTAQYSADDFAAAEVSLRRAVELDKSNALAYFFLGSTLVRQGQSEAPRPFFDEAARLDPRLRQAVD
jgi:tetratricopeptide (TPR) repeat protein